MISARLTVMQALETASRQSGSKRLMEVLRRVMTSVSSGERLSASLAKHPRIFDALYVNLVHIGEEAGALDDMLLRLATHKEKSAELKRKLWQAMTYPLVVLAVALGATIFLLTTIVPTFADMFASFGAELPGPTTFILGISTGLTTHAGSLFVGAAILFVFIGIISRQSAVQYQWHRWSLKIPLVGALHLNGQVAHFCRTLGTLLSSGVVLVESLEILQRATSNTFIKDEIKRLRKAVSKGQSIHEPLARAGFFPEMVVQMIAAGEETAKLSPMLLHTALFYEGEVDSFLDRLSSLIEPLMIVGIGLLLGGILIAMYLPMFDLVTILQ